MSKNFKDGERVELIGVNGDYGLFSIENVRNGSVDVWVNGVAGGEWEDKSYVERLEKVFSDNGMLSEDGKVRIGINWTKNVFVREGNSEIEDNDPMKNNSDVLFRFYDKDLGDHVDIVLNTFSLVEYGSKDILEDEKIYFMFI